MVMPIIQQKTGMPSHYPPYLNWTESKASLKVAPKAGASSSFQYIFPAQKYVEAYAAQTGKGWGGFITYLNYNHGNQPYAAFDSGIRTAHFTPRLPNWYALSKVSPKSSAPGIQKAQDTMAQQLALRSSSSMYKIGQLG